MRPDAWREDLFVCLCVCVCVPRVGPKTASLQLLPCVPRAAGGCMSAERGGAYFLSSLCCMLVVYRANLPFPHVFPLFSTATRKCVCVCVCVCVCDGRKSSNLQKGTHKIARYPLRNASADSRRPRRREHERSFFENQLIRNPLGPRGVA